MVADLVELAGADAREGERVEDDDDVPLGRQLALAALVGLFAAHFLPALTAVTLGVLVLYLTLVFTSAV